MFTTFYQCQHNTTTTIIASLLVKIIVCYHHDHYLFIQGHDVKIMQSNASPRLKSSNLDSLATQQIFGTYYHYTSLTTYPFIKISYIYNLPMYHYRQLLSVYLSNTFYLIPIHLSNFLTHLSIHLCICASNYLSIYSHTHQCI